MHLRFGINLLLSNFHSIPESVLVYMYRVHAVQSVQQVNCEKKNTVRVF